MLWLCALLLFQRHKFQSLHYHHRLIHVLFLSTTDHLRCVRVVVFVCDDNSNSDHIVFTDICLGQTPFNILEDLSGLLGHIIRNAHITIIKTGASQDKHPFPIVYYTGVVQQLFKI